MQKLGYQYIFFSRKNYKAEASYNLEQISICEGKITAFLQAQTVHKHIQSNIANKNQPRMVLQEIQVSNIVHIRHTLIMPLLGVAWRSSRT